MVMHRKALTYLRIITFAASDEEDGKIINRRLIARSITN